MTLLTFVVWLCVLGYELWPESDYGNCWTYALRMYAVYGGYVCIRNAHGNVKFLKFFPVPHIIWANTLHPETEVKQFVPVNRKHGDYFPWYTLWYYGKIKENESPHFGTYNPNESN